MIDLRRWIRVGVPAVAAGFFSLGADASEEAESAATDVPTVNVWGILPEDVEDAPGAAAVLTADEIEKLRPYTLHDAFDFMPGLRALDDDALGRRSGIGIRGSPTRRSRNVLLLEDGTPINASTYLDASAHYTPPMERLERVEALKANGQILYGPLNNHGIVNFRNKRPTATPQTTLDVAAGNQNATKQHLMHQRTDGALGTVLSYTRFKADGVFDVEDTEYQDFYAGFDWALDARNHLRFSALYFRERSHYDESNLTPEEYAIAPRRKRGRFGQEYNTIAVDYLKGDAMHEVQFNDRWSMATKLFVTDLDRPRFTADPGDYDVASLPDLVLEDGEGTFVPGVSGVMISRDRHYRTYGIDNRMTLDGVEAFGWEHTLEWGVRYEHHRFLDRRSEGEIGELLTEKNRGPKTRDEKYRANAASAFVQDTMRIGDWSVIPGVRVERYSQTRQRVFPTVNPREEYDKSIVLPGISALYDGFEKAQLFASIQRGYSPATARGSDFPLVPEIGVNTQIGVRSNVAPGFEIEAAAFYNRLRDTLVQLPYIDPVTFASVVINAEDSEAKGVDLGVRFDSRSLAQSSLSWFGALAYSYTDARFTKGLSDGNRVPEVPRHSGSFTLGLDHSAGWSISATLTHEGAFFTDPANTRAPILADEDGEPLMPGDEIEIREPIVLGKVDGRTLLSARASFAIPRTQAVAWIQGRNLTDKEYIADYQNGLRPGAARSVIAGVTVRFRGSGR